MKALIVYAKLLLILGLGTAVLAACQTRDPTPLAAAPTATTQPSHTPIPTMVVTQTAVSTNTPSPTQTPTTAPTPTATATPLFEVSRPILSSQGQLAFIKNETLFVETAVASNDFREIARFVSNGAWSTDGLNLAFFIDNAPGNLGTNNVSIWDSAADSIAPLGTLNSNFPPDLPLNSEGNSMGLQLGNITWSPNGTKLSFTVWEQLEPNIGGVWIADFSEGNFDLEIEGYSTSQSWWISEDTVLVETHCGSPCRSLAAYKNGNLLWELPWQTSGQYIVSPNNDFLVNTGRIMGREPFATVEEIDLTTGEINVIWQATEPGYFPLFPPTISPDNRFVTFHFGGSDPWLDSGMLFVVDRNGRSYGQRPNSILVDWRLGGGPVVQESMADGQTQLVYWPLDGSAVQVFVSPGSFEFGSGKWSGDGRFFIYSTVDEVANQSHLYLWQPDNGAPMLLQTTVGTNGFRNFAWMPDSTAVYFNLGRTELWKLEDEAESLTLIASSSEE